MRFGLQTDVVTRLQTVDQVRMRLLAVALRDLLHEVRVRRSESAHLLEEVLEPSRTDELYDHGRVIGGIPQGVH